jgi:hypothetical protein
MWIDYILLSQASVQQRDVRIPQPDIFLDRQGRQTVASSLFSYYLHSTEGGRGIATSSAAKFIELSPCVHLGGGL